MKRIRPYTEIKEALLSLDNGGRFYNIFTKSNDGIISQSEIEKVGGLFNEKQKMILFLELSMTFLKEEDKKIIIGQLDDDLKQAYFHFKPQHLLPSQADEKGILASNAILKGVPKLIDEKSDFTGFIFIPIMAGKVMSFMMIPIIDNYHVYELRDEKTSKTFIIAHSRNLKPLPHEKILIGGLFKELKEGEDKNSTTTKFLEANYYIEDELK